jgi:hypothetical protein
MTDVRVDRLSRRSRLRGEKRSKHINRLQSHTHKSLALIRKVIGRGGKKLRAR